MQYHRYDETTKEYLHEFTAQPDQVTGGFLTPCNATQKKPPPRLLNPSKHIFKDGEWREVPDYRGQKAYNKKTLESRIVEDLGGIPDCDTFVQPADDCQKWECYGWIDDKEKQVQGMKGNRVGKKQREEAINSLKVLHKGHIYAVDTKNIALLEIAHSSKMMVAWFDVGANMTSLSTSDIHEIIQSAKSELAKIWKI